MPACDETFKQVLLELFDETFHEVHGNYLDRGTSLFETLRPVPAPVASQPVSASCANLAAQVDHVRYYLDVLEQYVAGTPPVAVDWGQSWRIGAVDEIEWARLKQELESSYQRLRAMIEGIENWSVGDRLNGAINALVHSAYHLGEIRQALCTLVQER